MSNKAAHSRAGVSTRVIVNRGKKVGKIFPGLGRADAVEEHGLLNGGGFDGSHLFQGLVAEDDVDGDAVLFRQRRSECAELVEQLAVGGRLRKQHV